MDLSLVFAHHDGVMATAIAYARVAPSVFLLPILNGNVLAGVVRTVVSMWMAIGVWPYAYGAPLALDAPVWVVLLREAAIGLVIAVAVAFPFWVFHALGAYIDNQRGATLSSVIDPANGVDTSELAGFFQWFGAVIYLHLGGMTLLLEVLARSYRVCAPFGACTLSAARVHAFLDVLVGHAIALSAPVVGALFLSEVILGLLSRFAPQVNAFALSLTIKSLIGFTILLIYFAATLPDAIVALFMRPDDVVRWLSPSVPGA
ncbi:EscT/YscT/HrcT family type III secretion system export apparatus protein [Pandoraea vervacti]|uniref:EscT/YscT/HrcT family type III secretion system export apparatus protein n=1 Tax=Pandoraea vervacti TaxID=656178 RepID=A0ABM5SU56_9BURK|nr:type III secretion system export apparatus subunit SctT [Pandoraea vervacti]AJP55952.1 EscT/YscT/HrcT family type III secretion system export apparatus protein [Pandoraea vervacti]